MLTFRAAILSITQLVAFRRQFSTNQSSEVRRLSSETPISFTNAQGISVIVTIIAAIFGSSAYINNSNMATLKVQGEANEKLLDASIESRASSIKDSIEANAKLLDASIKANEKLLEKSMEISNKANASSIKESIEANAKLVDKTLSSMEKARRWFS